MKLFIQYLQAICEEKKQFIYTSIIIVCVITIAFDISFSYFRDIYLDSGIILKEMESIADGYIPYHTMHLNYPPLYFYWMVCLKWLLNIPYGCYYFYLTIHNLLLLGIGVFVYNIARSFGGNKPISVITACICLMQIFRYQGFYVIFEVPSLFWGLYSCVLVIRYANCKYHFLAGIMAAFSFLTKQFGAGFIVLNIFVLLFSDQKHKRQSVLYYIFGVLTPVLVTFALFGKEFFISTLFNGYGTKNNALAGDDISLSHKIDTIVIALKNFFRTCPIVFCVVLLPFILKTIRWKNFLFCILGLIGFSLQFYFVLFYQGNHYFQYLVPFAVLLIPVFSSLHSKKLVIIVFLGILVAICKCFQVTVLFPVKYHHLANPYTSQQALTAQAIIKERPSHKTLWIANTGLQQYYYLTNSATPNMANVGYSAGPWEITIEKATKQVAATDYILCYYDTTEINMYDYYFTKDLREYTYKHPFVELGDNIRLYKMK